MKVVGNKMYDICGNCGELVCLNKFILGSFHVCTTEEEQVLYKQEIAQKVKRAKNYYKI